jgi:SAM-dependent methyltransferase
MPVETVHLQEIPNDDTFDEAAYLAVNADVAAAVAAGKLRSGRVHFQRFGRTEGRRQKCLSRQGDVALQADLARLRAKKLARLETSFSRPPLATLQSGALNFLDAGGRSKLELDSVYQASENNYDAETIAMIEGVGEGLVLDVGAGLRPVYFGNVVNYEIVDYKTTDVVGAGDDLPFQDNSFDGVLSIAVLEHVKDPFRCAAELARVLKPGGWLKACAPFLQPLHGYPHHYFNMTHEGLRTLFEPYLSVERQEVTPPMHPVWAISWQLRVWADALPDSAKKRFKRMRVKDLLGHPVNLLQEPFARELPMGKQFELAAATVLIARKGLVR